MTPSSKEVRQLAKDIHLLEQQMAAIRQAENLTGSVATDVELLRPLVDEYQKLLKGFRVWAQEMEGRHEWLEHLSYLDELTGLSNRRHFHGEIEEAISRSRRSQVGMAVMFLDLDHFKLVNDQLGHHMGDLLLKKTSKRLQDCVRDADHLARLGGDEFAVIAEGVKSSRDVVIPAKRIVEALARPFELQGKEVFVGASIGVSLFPEDATDAEELLMHADIAMYRAKESRGAVVLFDSSMNASMAERVKEEARLREAIRNQEFELYFQPKIDVATGKTCGSEALVRWPQPDGSIVSPLKFIPLAEETRLIEPLGEWVLFEACRVLNVWRAAGFLDVQVSINASSIQLQNQEFACQVEKALKQYAIPPNLLEVEVTETLAMEDPEAVIEVMNHLRSFGVCIALDDFGTGYSSLSYLKKLPIDVLKLDREFIKGVVDIPDDAVMTTIMIQMAHQLGIKVVAEGVETIAQRDFLARKACDMIQGYLYSPPIPVELFTQRLTEQATDKK